MVNFVYLKENVFTVLKPNLIQITSSRGYFAHRLIRVIILYDIENNFRLCAELSRGLNTCLLPHT